MAVAGDGHTPDFDNSPWNLMNSPNDTTPLPPPLDLSGWHKLPAILMAGGAGLSVIGAAMNPKEFGFSWLLAFMFFLSIALGSLFLVMVHHLSDAGWSVATRRVCEHIASLLFPWLALLFLPVAFFAKYIYSWMAMDPHGNGSLSAKWPVFTLPGFYIASAFGGCFRPGCVVGRSSRTKSAARSAHTGCVSIRDGGW
jgi:hypothetical protein